MLLWQTVSFQMLNFQQIKKNITWWVSGGMFSTSAHTLNGSGVAVSSLPPPTHFLLPKSQRQAIGQRFYEVHADTLFRLLQHCKVRWDLNLVTS